jgi:pSer/pThr/pTyr-binding forkhead associated (FHA) protein
MDQNQAPTIDFEALTQTAKLSTDILEVMSGPEDGRIHEITKDYTTIGRQADRDFVLALDSTVSRQHGELRQKNGEYVLVDSGATNGTWIDEKQIEVRKEVPLQPNQIFRLGDVKLRLKLKVEDENRL